MSRPFDVDNAAHSCDEASDAGVEKEDKEDEEEDGPAKLDPGSISNPFMLPICSDDKSVGGLAIDGTGVASYMTIFRGDSRERLRGLNVNTLFIIGSGGANGQNQTRGYVCWFFCTTIITV